MPKYFSNFSVTVIHNKVIMVKIEPQRWIILCWCSFP